MGSFKKALMVYIAPSPADMMERRNKKTGTKSFSERKVGWGYSGFCIALFHNCNSLALKMSRLLNEETNVVEKPDFSHPV